MGTLVALAVVHLCEVHLCRRVVEDLHDSNVGDLRIQLMILCGDHFAICSGLRHCPSRSLDDRDRSPSRTSSEVDLRFSFDELAWDHTYLSHHCGAISHLSKIGDHLVEETSTCVLSYSSDHLFSPRSFWMDLFGFYDQSHNDHHTTHLLAFAASLTFSFGFWRTFSS